MSGVSPAIAGVKKPVPAFWTATSTSIVHTDGWPNSTRAAKVPSARNRTVSLTSITLRRPKRSATTPPASRHRTLTVTPAAITRPRSEADPPAARTAKATATRSMPVPKRERLWPM